jgi:methyl-accepting chemotaxis protein
MSQESNESKKDLNFYTKFFENVSDNFAVIEFKPDGTILRANDLFCSALEYTEKEIIGKHHSIFVDPEYTKSSEYKNFWKKLGGGETFTAEFKRITSSGKEIWIQASYCPITNDSGKVISVAKIAFDITVMKMNSVLKQLAEKSPVNILMASPDGLLTYMNENSLKTLKTLQDFLPAPADRLVGESIDWFHKNPAHQKNIIKDPKNLPYKAIIDVGPEKLDLLVSAVNDDDGNYLGPMVNWEIVTKKLQSEEAMARTQQMVDKSPVNTLMATPDGIMTYMNENSLSTLSTLQKFLPAPADKLVGESIDWFHKNPSHQKNIIKDPKNLPYKAVIDLGPEKLDLLVTAVNDNNGNYLGPMVNWSVVTTKLKLISDLSEASSQLAAASEELVSVANSMSANAEETSAQSNTASAASEQVSAGIQTVATNMEEMTASIREITKNTNDSSSKSNEAMNMAGEANTVIQKLGESSLDIGNVIKVITSIAQQTNLLALNATIEAARAGEAGKGFAVVANEVKELAKQTANATEDISRKIEAIQGDSQTAVTSIGSVSEAIAQVNGIAGNIASAMEEQAATTNEVARVVTESTQGVQQITENIQQVSQAAEQTGKGANDMQSAASNLSQIANSLAELVKKVKEE